MKMTFTEVSEKRVRFHAVSKFDASETPVDGGGTSRVITGVAIVYGQLSDDRGGYFVRIAPNSAKFTDPTLALYDHNYAEVIGNTKNSTLALVDSPDGLRVQITLPDTQTGRDVYTLVRDGYVSGMSFGTIPLTTKQYVENGQNIIEYTEMLVDEVTVTVNPAFTDTQIKAKLSAVASETPEAPAEPAVEPAPESNDMAEIEAETLKLAELQLGMYVLDEVE